MQQYWYRLKNRQMYRKTIFTHWYIPTVLYIRQTYRQTRQTEKNDQQTDRQIV